VKFIIKVLKQIVGIYEDKHSTHTVIHCDIKWQENPKQTKLEKEQHRRAYNDSPGCPVRLDNRCCLGCARLRTCKYRCERMCFVWQYDAYGKVIRERDKAKKITKSDFKTN